MHVIATSHASISAVAPKPVSRIGKTGDRRGRGTILCLLSRPTRSNALHAGSVSRFSPSRRVSAGVESTLFADLARRDAQLARRGDVWKRARISKVDERAGCPARLSAG